MQNLKTEVLHRKSVWTRVSHGMERLFFLFFHRGFEACQGIDVA